MYLEPDYFIPSGPDKCVVCIMGNTETLNIPLEKFLEGLIKRDLGDMIQIAFPTLSKKEQEFLLSGLTFEEQDQIFNNEEDEE